MDLYVVLGVPQEATESDIKRAYRRLARRFHPDINPGDRQAEARFRQILLAYETLSDPHRRSRYDAGHGIERPEDEPKTGFEGFDFSGRGVEHAATFGDLFAEVLTGRGTPKPGPERGADLHHDLQLSFDEAFSGVTRSLTLTRRVSCRSCVGTGVTRTSPGVCHHCQGTGSVRSVRGHMVFSRGCAACMGSGHRRPRPCAACAGAGLETRTETVEVVIPPGVAEGERLRVPGLGNAGMRGGQPGDLYLAIHVEAHAVFRRDGDDLHMVVPIAVHEAALGARIEISTPDGRARLRVPPGTQSGQRFRLRERGATSTRTGRRGDLIVEVRMMLPAVLDERSRELLREFGRINGESVRAHSPLGGHRESGRVE